MPPLYADYPLRANQGQEIIKSRYQKEGADTPSENTGSIRSRNRRGSMQWPAVLPESDV